MCYARFRPAYSHESPGSPHRGSAGLVSFPGGGVATLGINQHPKKRAFLEAYAKCGIIGTACRLVGINRGTYYLWAEHDDEFVAAASRARADAADLLEEEALQRATVGRPTVKEVYERGEDGDPVLVRREVSEGVSDTLLIFLLKGAKPEKFRERLDVQHSEAPPAKVYAGFDPGKV